MSVEDIQLVVEKWLSHSDDCDCKFCKLGQGFSTASEAVVYMVSTE